MISAFYDLRSIVSDTYNYVIQFSNFHVYKVVKLSPSNDKNYVLENAEARIFIRILMTYCLEN